MKPVRGSNYIDIPLTLDVANSASYINKVKLTIGYLIIVGIIVAAVVLCIVFRTVQVCILCIAAAVIGILLMRYCWFDERRYRRCYRNIAEHNNAYGSDMFWSIYEVSEGKMPICYYKNGQKALFVAFEKDIKIGADTDASEDHWDALTAAYRQLAYKKIQFMHIDYMDSIGKNKRLDATVDRLLQTPNTELRKLLGITFDYQKQLLQDSYLTYDVYVFYYNSDDNTFRADIETILNQMLQANYSHYYYMHIDELRELAKSLYGMPEFSALQATEAVFGDTSIKRKIKVISYTQNGETVKVHKTREEEAAAAQAQQEAKKQAKHKRMPIQKTVATKPQEVQKTESALETVTESITGENVAPNVDLKSVTTPTVRTVQRRVPKQVQATPAVNTVVTDNIEDSIDDEQISW